MKKISLSVLAIVSMLALTSCGIVTTSEEIIEGSVNYETQDIIDSKESDDNVSWKQFLKEYEEWVDKYIEITKKYTANPADMSVLTDYTKMMQELTEWSTKTQKMQEDLENASPSELAEYCAELARIVGKISIEVY